jgi:branched-chain amino acid transport system substrate-binding protein
MPSVAETNVITIGTWTTTVQCYDKVWQDYDHYKNWFGTNTNDWGLAQNCLYFLKEFVVDKLHAHKIVLFREDLVWTYGVKDYLYEECPKIGVEVVGDVVFPIDTADFTPFYHKCETSGADVIFMLLAAVSSVPLAQYSKLQVSLPMLGINPDVGKYELWADTGGGCEGVAAQYGLYPGKQSPRIQAFLKKWWDKYGTRPRQPTHPGFGAYQAMWLIHDACERAGTIESDAVIKELERTYGEFFCDWSPTPGGWFGLHRPEPPDVVPESIRKKYPAYDGPWEGQAVAPHTWGFPELIRWIQWQKPEEPGGYGKCVCIWPPEFADGNFTLPSWLQK